MGAWWMAVIAVGSIFAGCGVPVLTVEDALALPNGTVKLVAYVEREAPLSLRKKVEHVTVTFCFDDTEIGREQVNGKGCATIEARLPSPDISRFSVSTLADGQKLEAAGEIFRWQAEPVIIAVDIDGTLSHTEYKELILKKEDNESGPIKGARETLCSLTRDYHILYFTARPRMLQSKTRTWLREHEFPPGPMVMAPGLKQMMQPGEYKRRALAALRQNWPNLLIGIGNKKGDAEAYSSRGMLSLIVRQRMDKDVGIHAIHVRDWAALGKFFTANHEVLTDPARLRSVIEGDAMLLQAVQPWQEK
jgi:hypothetical protein